MIDTIIFDVGRVLVNWDYESYLKRFAFGPEKTKAIAAATFESPYWRQFDRGILAPEEIVKGFCSLAPEYTEEIKEVFAHCEETITPLPYAESWVRSLCRSIYWSITTIYGHFWTSLGFVSNCFKQCCSIRI